MKHLTATHKGIITALLLIAVSVFLFYGLKWPENGKSQYIVLVIYIAGIVWAQVTHKMNNKRYIAFKEFFSEGFKCFIVATLFMVLYTFIFYKLNPQILEKGILENNALLLKDGNHTPAEIETNANKLRSIFMPMMLSINTVKFLFLGALVAVVTGGFLSQKDQHPETYQSKKLPVDQ